jgi:DNA phosphorothioation-dependent restriction protein DptF
MDLRQALSVLSKSSPYAVSTDRTETLSPGLDEVKKYLYIKTDIEQDFFTELSGLSSNEQKIIFLCGSSGDGKSEILTKYCDEFSRRANFHLDATHSFKPNDSAIETLDKVFQDFNEGNKPLVVGINIGMLANYASEGGNQDIVGSIKSFLDGGIYPKNHTYINFEDYPKFTLGETGHSSLFAKRLLQCITAKENNIIRQYFDKEIISNRQDKKLCANYSLLSIDEVQDVIIDLLFKARLIKDQFLTTRALLDFVFHLISGPGYLQNNLFDSCDNELVSKICEFDPSYLRSKIIDDFVLSRSLKLSDTCFEQFRVDLVNLDITKEQTAQSYLRLFYLLRNTAFSNNYHTKFKTDFSEKLINNYSKIWHLHNMYDAISDKKIKIKAFYKDLAIAAIHKYNNRNAPNLNKGEFFICERNGYQLAAHIDLKVDIKSIENSAELHMKTVSQFNMFFKIGNEKEAKGIPANINLLNLMQRIVDGYRPNKHDKNTVVIMDEIVEMIANVACQSNTLYIMKKNQRIQITNIDNEDYEVSGL